MSAPRAILIGAGGHAGVVSDTLAALATPIEGLVTPDRALHGTERHGLRVLGDDDAVLRYAPEEVVLVNAIGSVSDTSSRRNAYQRFKSRGYRFLTLVHPSATISPGARLGEGVQVLARAVVQHGAVLGENCLVNTGAIVEHDCILGRDTHLATGAILCGGVHIGDGTHVGAGAVVIQGLRVDRDCTIAAGAVVIRDVPAHVTVAGVPAKEVASNG
ncbi:MAG TPA: acetyltransferase [Burkholderiales bacterium]|nr:acetyltransferase [Burkholderiales bacterium]